MDKELLLDIYGYLPEKYFVSRSLIRTFQTRVSFVDYERKVYRLTQWKKSSSKVESIHWKRRGITYQEYGPAVYSSDYSYYKWMDQKGSLHRKNGPAFTRKESPFDDILEPVAKMEEWYTHGMILKATIEGEDFVFSDSFGL